ADGHDGEPDRHIFPTRQATSAPAAPLGEGEHFAERDLADEGLEGTGGELELPLDLRRDGTGGARPVKDDIGIEQIAARRMIHAQLNSSTAAAKSSSLSSAGTAPRMAANADFSPGRSNV